MKIKFFLLLSLWLSGQVFGSSNKNKSPNFHRIDEYTTSVTFPATFVVGDYQEFVEVAPIAASSSGYYLISIAYAGQSIAASATHLASISHYNPAVWREVGRINNNGYTSLGQNFTVDCNTEMFHTRFRIRAINTLGLRTPLVVQIKITSVNFNQSYTPLNVTGNDTTVDKFLPMTNEWDLYVGNPFVGDGASIAIKALVNGNVGIGTPTPTEKLSVNGKIRAKEIKVETSNWPDYVFEADYKVESLATLESYIKANKHLPDVPSAKDVVANGVELGEMNKILLKKIEELTLHLIEKEKKMESQEKRLIVLENAIINFKKLKK